MQSRLLKRPSVLVGIVILAYASFLAVLLSAAMTKPAGAAESPLPVPLSPIETPAPVHASDGSAFLEPTKQPRPRVVLPVAQPAATAVPVLMPETGGKGAILLPMLILGIAFLTAASMASRK